MTTKCTRCGHVVELTAKDLEALFKAPRGVGVLCNGCLFVYYMENDPDDGIRIRIDS